MLLTTENIILIGALLLLVSVFAGKVAYRFGAPALLLFLGVGMLFGLRLISFNSAPVAQFVGMVALCIILFSGGMDTRYRAIRPVIGPGVVLKAPRKQFFRLGVGDSDVELFFHAEEEFGGLQ